MKIKSLLSLLLLMFLFGPVSKSFSQTCPDGMISYWKLQEAAGPTYHDEKGVHNATATSSAPMQTSGISGKAQLFSGAASTYLSVPDHSAYDWSGTSSFSIEFWAKFSGTGSTEVIVGRDDELTQVHWYVAETASGTIEFFVRASDGSNADCETAIAYNNNQWHHIVAVRDNSQGKLFIYVDGTQRATVSISLGGTLSSSAPITFGNMVFDGNPDYFYTGALDEVAIYNLALSSSVITQHYNNISQYAIGYCDGENPIILTEPVLFASVGQQYTYDVDASGNSVPTYALLEKPEGMTINATTGEIAWTPASMNINARVTVRVSNNKGNVDQSFIIFIAASPVCRENLIAYWDFNSASGQPYTDNTGAYTLTGEGPAVATGKIGRGVAFDGVNDSLDLKDDVEPSKIFFDWDNIPSYSIELWMKSGATPERPMVMVGRDEETNNSQFWLGVNPDGSVGYYMSDYDTPVTDLYLEGGSVLDNQWHHIVATYDATANLATLYVDKEVVATGNEDLQNMGGNSDLNIGCMNDLAGEKFWYSGTIDELAFYNTPLNQTRVDANYDAATLGNGACVYNYAPVITSSPDSVVNEDSQYSYKLVAYDRNQQDQLTISVVSKPDWLTFVYSANDTFATVIGTPDNALVGKHTVTLRVADAEAHVDQTFTIRVANTNDLPTFTSTPVTTVHSNALYSYLITATDPDAGAVLTYTAVSKPTWLTLTQGTNNATLSGTPTQADMGSHAIVIKVNDGVGDVQQSFTLQVTGPSAVPEIDENMVESVYPNPSSGVVYFKLNESGKARIEIYDLSGNLKKSIISEEDNLISVDISDLSNGVYIYKAFRDDKVYIGKITRK